MKDTVSRIVTAAGLLLLVAGASMYPVGSLGDRLPLALFFAGLGLLVLTALANIGTLAAFSRKRSARHGANAVLMTLLFAAALVVIQAISMRNTHRIDVTANKRFTPTEQTLSVLERIDDKIIVTAFFRSSDVKSVLAVNLLSMYKHHNKLIRFSLVDPDRKPHIAENKRVRQGQVLVEYKDSRRVIDGISEEKLTNAILLATRQVQKTIYFVTGHNEKRIDYNGREGLSAARISLEEQGFAVYQLSLLDVDSIPPDCAVLILAGPKKELLDHEAAMVASYLERGGSVFFLLDPR
ncbi:MAG: GldG family protein, partial [Candidatus Krumholzibacteria bacterium]|nr:GldG family protein [Candidatus Krumholzibacteria bacterium]